MFLVFIQEETPLCHNIMISTVPEGIWSHHGIDIILTYWPALTSMLRHLRATASHYSPSWLSEHRCSSVSWWSGRQSPQRSFLFSSPPPPPLLLCAPLLLPALSPPGANTLHTHIPPSSLVGHKTHLVVKTVTAFCGITHVFYKSSMMSRIPISGCGCLFTAITAIVISV